MYLASGILTTAVLFSDFPPSPSLSQKATVLQLWVGHLKEGTQYVSIVFFNVD